HVQDRVGPTIGLEFIPRHPVERRFADAAPRHRERNHVADRGAAGILLFEVVVEKALIGVSFYPWDGHHRPERGAGHDRRARAELRSAGARLRSRSVRKGPRHSAGLHRFGNCVAWLGGSTERGLASDQAIDAARPHREQTACFVDPACYLELAVEIKAGVPQECGGVILILAEFHFSSLKLSRPSTPSLSLRNRPESPQALEL